MISSAIPRRRLRRTFAGALLPLMALSAAHAETYLQSVNQSSSGSWHTLSLWNTNGADTPAGTAPASINFSDHFVASRDGWSLRTPTTSSTFQGGSLTLGGTAQLLLTGGPSVISTVPALTTTGGAFIGGGTTRNFSADTFTAASGSAAFTSTTGGVINLFVGDLVGSGNLTISGPGKVIPSIDQAGGYTGTITVHNGGTLHVMTPLDIGGRLAVNSGGNVILDDDAHVGALSVAGTVRPAGIYTAASLGSGFSGAGQLVVSDVGSLSIPTEVIVDNLDATLTGGWVSNTHVAGYYGVDYHHDNNTGKGAKTAQFTPSLTAAGSYEVFMRWTAGWNRATNAPVTITHAGGTESTTVNQQLNNNTWVSLGTYAFATGTSGHVTLGNAGTDGHVMADAVKFTPVAVPTEVIVDNLEATFTGEWVTNTHVSGYYGTNYHHDNNTGKGTKTAQFTPSLAAAGAYEVFVRWTAASNRATNVPVTIAHAGGTASATVNQRNNNNVWVSVGTFEFAAGTAGSVTFGTTATNGHVIVDAVRFLPANGTPPPPPPPPPPASDPALVVNYDFLAGHTLAPKNGWSFANTNWALSPLPGGGGNALPFTFNGVTPGEYGWSEMRFGMPAAPEEFWMRLRLHIPQNYHHRFDSYIEVQNAQGAGWQVGDILRGTDGVSQGTISHITSTTVYMRNTAQYYYDHIWKGTITNVTRSNTRTSTKRGIWPANNKLLAIWSDGYSAAGDGSTIIWQTDLWDSLNQSSITVGYTVGDQTVTGTPVGGGILITDADKGTYMDIIFNGKYSTSKGAANGVIRTWVRKQGQSSYIRRINITNAVLNKPDGLSPALQSWRAGYLMGWSNSGFDQTTTFHLSKIEVYNAMPAVLAP